jgi:hypothetical protein
MVFSLVCDRLLEAFHLENLEDFQWDHLEDTVEETLSASRYDPHFISREMYSETRNNKDVKRYIEYKRKKLLNCVKAKKPEWVIEAKKDESEEKYKKIQESLGVQEEWPTVKLNTNNVNPAFRQSLMDQMGINPPPMPQAKPTTFAEKQNVYQNMLAQVASEMKHNPADLNNFRNVQ